MASIRGLISNWHDERKERRDGKGISHRLLFYVTNEAEKKLITTFEVKKYISIFKDGDEVVCTYNVKPLTGGKTTNELVNLIGVDPDAEEHDIPAPTEEAKPKEEFKAADKFVNSQRLGLCCNLVSRFEIFGRSEIDEPKFKEFVKKFYRLIGEIENELSQ